MGDAKTTQARKKRKVNQTQESEKKSAKETEAFG